MPKKQRISSSSLSASNSDDSEANDSKKALPVAELIRRNKGKSATNGECQGGAREEKSGSSMDIDDEIKRLEAELADDSSSDSDSDTDSDSSESVNAQKINRKADQNDYNNERKKRIKFGNDTILNPQDDATTSVMDSSKTNNILCLSSCAKEKIIPLPSSALPTCKSKKLKIDREAEKASGNRVGCQQVSDGLRDAVKEVLSGYVARSAEKIPFYCRVCSLKCENEDDFKKHKRTEFHKVAVQMEKKATYCKVCRKQLTSMVQMKEHLNSKPHRERMNSVMNKQHGGPGKRATHANRSRNGNNQGMGDRSSYRSQGSWHDRDSHGRFSKGGRDRKHPKTYR